MRVCLVGKRQSPIHLSLSNYVIESDKGDSTNRGPTLTFPLKDYLIEHLPFAKKIARQDRITKGNNPPDFCP